MGGESTLCSRHQLVTNPNIGEGASHHHFVVAATAAERVEVARSDPFADEILASRAGVWEGTCRGDMVGGYRVSEFEQDMGPADGLDWLRFRGDTLKEGWKSNIGALFGPRIECGLDALDGVPAWLFGDIRIASAEHLGSDGCGHGLANLLVARPDVSEEYVVALGVLAERVVLQINVEGSGECIGDDKWRACKVVRLDFLVDSALKVTIAREH